MDLLEGVQSSNEQLNLFSLNDDFFKDDELSFEYEYGNTIFEEVSDEKTHENNFVIKKRKKPIYCQHYRWTNYEDDILRKLVEEFGENDWRHLAKRMDGRNSRQCRERWQYYLNPNLKVGDWTKEEDELILSKTKELGPKWMTIKNFFPNRTDAMIKNRYRFLMKNKNKKVETFFDYLEKTNLSDSPNKIDNSEKDNNEIKTSNNNENREIIEKSDYLSYLKNDANDEDNDFYFQNDFY